MNKRKKKYKHDLSLPLSCGLADALFVQILRYWEDVLTPKEGQWEHAEDVAPRVKRQEAIKVLLEYMGEA